MLPRLRRPNQRLDQRILPITRPIKRHLDRNHIRIQARGFHKRLDARRERLVGQMAHQIALFVQEVEEFVRGGGMVKVEGFGDTRGVGRGFEVGAVDPHQGPEAGQVHEAPVAVSKGKQASVNNARPHERQDRPLRLLTCCKRPPA